MFVGRCVVDHRLSAIGFGACRIRGCIHHPSDVGLHSRREGVQLFACQGCFGVFENDTPFALRGIGVVYMSLAAKNPREIKVS